MRPLEWDSQEQLVRGPCHRLERPCASNDAVEMTASSPVRMLHQDTGRKYFTSVRYIIVIM